LVRTPQGQVECDMVIVAVDGRLEEVLPELQGRVRTARLQMLATEPTEEVSLARPVYRRWGYDYFQQLASGEVVLGGCRDLFASAEWNAPAEPSDDVQRALELMLRGVVGVTNARVTHRWAGRVAYADNHLPVCEEVRSGVVACGAYSGTGNVVGALAGRAAVALALGEKTITAGLFARP
jgi:glycine/D-amino acid oxidase-like deaminating enzyme